MTTISSYNRMMRIHVAVAVVFAVFAGCQKGSQVDGGKKVGFALVGTSQMDDWKVLKKSLDDNVEIFEGDVHLGTLEIMVQKQQFTKAKRLAVDCIKEESLSLRLASKANSAYFEIYEKGRRIGEETYKVKPKAK